MKRPSLLWKEQVDHAAGALRRFENGLEDATDEMFLERTHEPRLQVIARMGERPRHGDSRPKVAVFFASENIFAGAGEFRDDYRRDTKLESAVDFA